MTHSAGVGTVTATKDDITKYTKPELIKALRAAWARETRLAKKIEKLEAQLSTALEYPPDVHVEVTQDLPSNVERSLTGHGYHFVSSTPAPDTVSELVPAADEYLAGIQAKNIRNLAGEQTKPFGAGYEDAGMMGVENNAPSFPWERGEE